jgi:hypothetical protein
MALQSTGNSDIESLPPQWDPKVERRLVWKVDLILMPVMTFTYGLQFVSALRLLCEMNTTNYKSVRQIDF